MTNAYWPAKNFMTISMRNKNKNISRIINTSTDYSTNDKNPTLPSMVSVLGLTIAASSHSILVLSAYLCSGQPTSFSFILRSF